MIQSAFRRGGWRSHWFVLVHATHLTGPCHAVGPTKINDHFEAFIEDRKLLEEIKSEMKGKNNDSY